MSNNDQPIVCDLTVLPSSVRTQMTAVISEIFQAVQKVQELTNGYAFQFPNKPGMFMKVAQFVEHERQCCAFYQFSLEVESGGGPIWLRLMGSEGVKQFIETTFGNLPEAVSKQLIKCDPDDNLDGVIAQATPILANTLAKADPLS